MPQTAVQNPKTIPSTLKFLDSNVPVTTTNLLAKDINNNIKCEDLIHRYDLSAKLSPHRNLETNDGRHLELENVRSRGDCLSPKHQVIGAIKPPKFIYENNLHLVSNKVIESTLSPITSTSSFSGVLSMYPTPQSSPTQTEYHCFCKQALSNYSPLKRKSEHQQEQQQQEYCMLHVLPPSPSESSCESPPPTHSTTAANYMEYDRILKVNAKHSFDTNKWHENFFNRKHYSNKLELDSFIRYLIQERDDIELIMSLAMRDAKCEINDICTRLNISSDPKLLSSKQMQEWLRYTIEQFQLPSIQNLESQFPENGIQLLSLSEDEFLRRAPQCGSVLYAQLKIWNLTCDSAEQSSLQVLRNMNNINTTANAGVIKPQTLNIVNINSSQDKVLPMQNPRICNQLQLQEQQQQQQANTIPPIKGIQILSTEHQPLQTINHEQGDISITNNISTNNSGNENVTTACELPAQDNANISVRRYGSRHPNNTHVYLWKFLKELLATPQINGAAIRWVDRNLGIFKIEDSVKVAKLWGIRKNRPAMNYDKLSRSIRQYYKKGIMKKTERSQRLVYQFCHPYHK